MKPSRRELSARTFFGLVVAAGLALCIGAYLIGALFNVLFLSLPVLLGAVIISRIHGAYRKTLEPGLLRRPFAKASRMYLLQLAGQWSYLALVTATLWIAIVPVQFTADEYRFVWTLIALQVGVLSVLALVPQRRIRFSTNLFFVALSVFLGVELLRIAAPPAESQAVLLGPPFRGEWSVGQGGRSALVNHHYPIEAQRHALDLLKTEAGRDARGDRSRLESFPCFGERVQAPADGRVVRVVDDRPDMPVGEADRERIVGNHVVLDIGQGRFVLLAHLKQGSAQVVREQGVQRGQDVAECGNSGNTSQPHLHLQVQSSPDFDASGLRTLPILFEGVVRVRHGNRERLQAADVRRGDLVMPISEAGTTAPKPPASSPRAP